MEFTIGLVFKHFQDYSYYFVQLQFYFLVTSLQSPMLYQFVLSFMNHPLTAVKTNEIVNYMLLKLVKQIS